MEHETVEAPEEGSESLAGAGGGQDERALAARDDRPAQPLRGGGRVKDGLEPLGRDGMEAGEWIGRGRSGLGGCGDMAAFENSADERRRGSERTEQGTRMRSTKWQDRDRRFRCSPAKTKKLNQCIKFCGCTSIHKRSTHIAYHDLAGVPMRDHLATLLDDFRRFDREIAVVRYQGNRRRVTTYAEIARLAGRFAALLAAA